MFDTILLEMCILCAAGLLMSAIGFYRVVYFISIGYAFSICLMAIIAPLRFMDELTWVSILQNILFLWWGLRLGIFLVRREAKSSYRGEIAEVHKSSAQMGIPKRALIWVGVSVLYVLMYSPGLFMLLQFESALDSTSDYILPVIGLIIMAGGTVLESVADSQKSSFKKSQPRRFCDTGIYRLVRCPNYLGEILFWVGSFIIPIGVYSSPFQWMSVLIGLICIVLIMLGSTKRLEFSQDDRYGKDPEYQEYTKRVPVLIPWIPLYSLKKIKVFLE